MRQILLLLLCLASPLTAAVPARAADPGALDPSFSGDGRQTTDFGRDDDGRATAIGPDGKIVVVGDTELFRGPSDPAIARYNHDGSLDRSFSGDGRVPLDFPNATGSASDVAIEGGKIVVAGSYNRDFLALRLNSDGTFDRTFSGDGRALVDLGRTFDSAGGLALDSRGRIVLAGSADDEVGSTDFAVARLDPNGSLDSTFSGDGKARLDFRGQYSSTAAVALQPDNRIVLAGSAGGDFALARLTQAGALDPTFSVDGKTTTNLRGEDFAADLAIQRSGRIVVAGSSYGGARASVDFALARYGPGGALDPTFSGDGKQLVDFGGENAARGVALQRDGKIVVAGYGGLADFEVRFALARLNVRGGLDRSFSGDGKVTTKFPGASDASDVKVQPDGKILAVGSSGSDFALARYRGSQPGPRPGCTVTGSSRNDVLLGTPGDDVICAGAGNDVVRARGGNDIVYGGPGNDALRADGGWDRLYGQGGNDALNASDGRRGNDSADGGDGNDACRGDPGDRRRSCS